MSGIIKNKNKNKNENKKIQLGIEIRIPELMWLTKPRKIYSTFDSIFWKDLLERRAADRLQCIL